MEMLANKNVLIIGATGGIGSETAKLLKQSQANYDQPRSQAPRKARR
jgi:short-subunit dehydrogenase